MQQPQAGWVAFVVGRAHAHAWLCVTPRMIGLFPEGSEGLYATDFVTKADNHPPRLSGAARCDAGTNACVLRLVRCFFERVCVDKCGNVWQAAVQCVFVRCDSELGCRLSICAHAHRPMCCLGLWRLMTVFGASDWQAVCGWGVCSSRNACVCPAGLLHHTSGVSRLLCVCEAHPVGLS